MASAICNLWKICQCLLHQITREVMLLLVNNVNEKSITENQDGRNFECAFCNLHSCYNFALMLHENALVLSQSETRNVFYVHYYILSKCLFVCRNWLLVDLQMCWDPFFLVSLWVVHFPGLWFKKASQEHR